MSISSRLSRTYRVGSDGGLWRNPVPLLLHEFSVSLTSVDGLLLLPECRPRVQIWDTAYDQILHTLSSSYLTFYKICIGADCETSDWICTFTDAILHMKRSTKKNKKTWNTHPHLVEVFLSILCHCVALPEVPWLIFHFCPSSGHAFWIPSYENDSNAWNEPLNKQTNVLLTAEININGKQLTVAGWMIEGKWFNERVSKRWRT